MVGGPLCRRCPGSHANRPAVLRAVGHTRPSRIESVVSGPGSRRTGRRDGVRADGWLTSECGPAAAAVTRWPAAGTKPHRDKASADDYGGDQHQTRGEQQDPGTTKPGIPCDMRRSMSRHTCAPNLPIVGSFRHEMEARRQHPSAPRETPWRPSRCGLPSPCIRDGVLRHVPIHASSCAYRSLGWDDENSNSRQPCHPQGDRISTGARRLDAVRRPTAFL